MELVRKIKILIVAFLVLFGHTSFAANTNEAYSKFQIIKKKQAQAHAKIKHLRVLENIETNKLYKNQRKLETTQINLKHSQNEYTHKQQQLLVMEASLRKANLEFLELDNELKDRVRQIFKNQRVGFLQLILSSNDINCAIDQVYFEGIVVKEDFKRLNLARAKARQIVAIRAQIEQQKKSLQRTINDINCKQKIIKTNIAQNKDMINRLKNDRNYYERSERELARQSASIQAMISNLGRGGKTSNIKVTSGFIKPISGPITSPFGYRIHPIFKSRIFHSGIDIGGPNGGAVRASNNGKVIYAGWYGGYGQVVILDHGVVRGQPITTLYAHLSSISVSKGQTVSKGQQVGREGSTGYSTGPHCHFEVRINGQPRNPLNYI